MKKALCTVFLLFMGTMVAQETLDEILKRHNLGGVRYISSPELKMLIENKSVLILDGREQIEYDVSHIPNAEHIGYNGFSLDELKEEYRTTGQSIVVYCTLGIRSETLAKKLIYAGYGDVRNLYGGICEWKNRGYTVIDSTQMETENVHTFSKEWGKWLINGVKIYD